MLDLRILLYKINQFADLYKSEAGDSIRRAVENTVGSGRGIPRDDRVLGRNSTRPRSTLPDAPATGDLAAVHRPIFIRGAANELSTKASAYTNCLTNEHAKYNL